MARIFRQHYTQKLLDGRRVKRQSRKWYVEYRDGDRIRRRVPGYTDKQATQQLASELERRAEREQSGLADKYMDHRKRPLSEHLADFEKHQRDRGLSAQHLRTLIPRVRKVFAGCGFVFWPDITPTKVTAFLAGMRERGASVQTANFYLAAVKGFCRWFVQNGRAPESPVAHLHGGNVRTDRRHDRRALAEGELRMLLDITRNGPARFDMTGSEREMLYQLAVETGLRASELRTLTWGSFKLDDDPPTVTVGAAYSKHRREDVLPLKASLAHTLARWRDEKGEVDRGHPVFPSMPEKLAAMMRADLRKARAVWIRAVADPQDRRERRDSGFLAYRDESGRVADFHALRHTFISNLVRGGIHPKLAQQLARHSTISLTMDRYTHTVMGELSDALAALPTLTSDPPEAEQLQATGTCDMPQKTLPISLPKNLPSRAASRKPSAASHRIGSENAMGATPQGNREKIGISCTPLHPDSPYSVTDLSLRRTGLEPVTFGSVDRCSIQLS